MEGIKETTRGGRHEPLPRFDLTIPNYRKYQAPVRGRRDWVKWDRETINDPLYWQWPHLVRLLFRELVERSDEGKWLNVTAADIAKRLNWRAQTISVCMDRLILDERINTTGPHKNPKIKREANESQTPFKRKANENVCDAFGRPSDSAGLGIAPLERDKERREEENPPPSPLPTDDHFPDATKMVATSGSLSGVQQDRFDQFWAAYPKKTGKGVVRKLWERLKPSSELFATIMDAVAKQRQSDQWLRDGGRYVPNPLTWLNQGRWDDEIQTNDPLAGMDAETRQIIEQGLGGGW